MSRNLGAAGRLLRGGGCYVFILHWNRSRGGTAEDANRWETVQVTGFDNRGMAQSWGRNLVAHPRLRLRDGIESSIFATAAAKEAPCRPVASQNSHRV